jgi:hypothetical protein
LPILSPQLASPDQPPTGENEGQGGAEGQGGGEGEDRGEGEVGVSDITSVRWNDKKKHAEWMTKFSGMQHKILCSSLNRTFSPLIDFPKKNRQILATIDLVQWVPQTTLCKILYLTGLRLFDRV